MKKTVALAALLASLAGPVAAQTATVAAPLDRQTFRTMAMMSDAFEIESSRLALERSRNPRVRAYAQRMITDHMATTQALNGGAPMVAGGGSPATGALAGGALGAVVAGPVGAVVGAGVGAAAGSGPTATGAVMVGGAPLDARKAAMLNQLASASGPTFDRLYGRAQRMSHQEALAVFTSYAQNGTDPAHVQFARSVIPHLQMHLTAARRLPG